MSPWIEACKTEVRAILDAVQQQFMGSLKMRVSVVAYRDFLNARDGKQYELFNFSENIGEVETFLGKLRAIGNDDNPEDVAGGLFLGLK